MPLNINAVFWGAAIVFFLAKFIDFHNSNTQGLWVEISSQVENGNAVLLFDRASFR